MLGGSLLTINGTDVLKFDLPDSLKVELVADSLAVTGSIGRTVAVGTVKVGGVIPINIPIPPPAAQDSVKPEPPPPKSPSKKSVTHNKSESLSSAKPATKQGSKSGRPARD